MVVEGVLEVGGGGASGEPVVEEGEARPDEGVAQAGADEAERREGALFDRERGAVPAGLEDGAVVDADEAEGSEAVERGVRWYGVMRAMQLRRLRLPEDDPWNPRRILGLS